MVPHVGERFKALIEIGNSGRTAARHTSSNIVLELLPSHREPATTTHPYNGDYTVPPNTGGVGVEMTFELKLNNRIVGPLSPALEESMLRGHAVPFLHGRVNFGRIVGVRPTLFGGVRIGERMLMRELRMKVDD